MTLARQPHTRIASFFDQAVDPCSLATDHDANALFEVELPRKHLAAWVERDAPHARTLDLGDGRRKTGNHGDRQQLRRARAGFHRRGRQRCAAMLGHDRTISAGYLGAAQDGAEILRILDPIERDQQRWARRQKFLERPVFARLELGGHTLVYAGRHLVEARGRNSLDAHQLRELVQSRIVAEPGRLIDPDHATGARGLEDGVSPVNQLTHTNGMVADFMTRARELLASGAELSALGNLLATESRERGFVPEAEMRSLHGGDSTFTILQTDEDGLTLMLARFSALEETPVHDHGSWGVACVVRGRDRYRHYRVDGNDVSLLYEKELPEGSFVTWPGPPNDVHSQQGIGGDAWELVLFGKDVTKIPRHYYDLETGKVRTALPQ